MATFYDAITEAQADLIATAPLFFVATADPSLSDSPDGAGPVNLSPRGGETLHVIDPHRVAFLDWAGSGNETARHALAGGPITVMVCSFDAQDAAIVRLYGRARITPVEESGLAERLVQGSTAERPLPLRQVVEVEVTRTMTSCGYGVPIMALVRQRGKADRGRRYK